MICLLYLEAVFEPDGPRTDEQKLERKNLALSNFQTFLRPLIGLALGQENFSKGTELVFNSLQDPVINKQVISIIIRMLRVITNL